MRTYFCLCFIALLLFSCNSDTTTTATGNSSRGPAESLDIQLKVANVVPGKVSLIGSFAGQNYRQDSAFVDASGVIRFQQAESLTPGMYYVVFSDNSNLQIIIDQDQTMELETSAPDFVANTIVKGNIDTELLYETMRYERNYREELVPVNEQLGQASEGTPAYTAAKTAQEQIIANRKAFLADIYQRYPNALFTTFKRAGQNPDVQEIRNADGSINTVAQVYAYRRAMWEGVDFSDDRLLHTPVITNKLRRYIDKLTVQNADSINNAASFLIDQVLNYPKYYKYFTNDIAVTYEPTKTTVMDAEKIFVHMVQNYFTRERAVWADSMTVYALQQRAYEMAASVTGKKGPNVTAKDPSGQLRSIYDLTSDYIIVYLYNPTCEHCMVETPKLVQFYQEWKNRGVDVYAIAIETTDQEWKDYIAKTGMPFTNVFDPTNEAIYAKYYVDITPEVYVLDKNRTIIAKNIKVNQIAQIIN